MIVLLRSALGVPVVNELGAQRPARFVLVDRTGGPMVNEAVDGPQFRLECWDSDDAEGLAYAVWSAVWSARGSYVDYGGGRAWITRVEEIGGPAHVPHPDVPEQDRWVLALRMGIAVNS
ncbi:hypothetical protein [Nocardia transvalensis]|uniref:hypothetical protein n=1 Tax=Nocardia transvalensis TaxID=37333 RepID=UPI001895FA4C|nr:hypothetical protein [Nocardia transvalensis]MBF6333443.1 hypothetical protein [Nocardia transvalensis]